MKIRKIEFENFRNFKDHGEIKCSTDGKVTIVYGKNGDGKTTLHQLFQWVFYGQVHFNKTTTERLYNLQYESECSFGDTFQVMGCIDFEHDGAEYSLRRTYTYRKGVDEAEKIGEDMSLSKMDEDYNWRRVDCPRDVIEKLLPSGLSDYFFFDGESMIADLRVKGKDSAGKLRKALYSMFDLDVVESAIAHIGRTDLRTTVLGKLYLSKGTISSGSQISATKTNIEQIQVRLAKFEQDIADATAEQTAKQNLLVELSEKIGGHKSKSDYERQRKACKTQRDIFLKNAEAAQASFGDAVLDMFPQLLISKAVADAKKKIHLKVEQQKLPGGVNKKLINYLLAAGTTECVCGRPLCAEEKAHIEAYLSMLPPKSFSSLYQEFSNTARIWGKGYDKSRIEAYIMTVLENNDQASECDNRIRELDEAEKKSPDIESLIVARQQAESDLRDLERRIMTLNTEKKKLEILLKQQMKLFDQYTQENAAAVKVNGKIQIMEQVAAYFRRKLEQASLTYSQSLEANIQSLIDAMLTSKRKVAVSPEFSVRVTDSFNDESKSEGQFAVVSFAYIGGILKMLRSEEQLSAKEYPLVLDGPFSKLDPDQRQNVVNMIPEFAPQVILFSKDDLHGVFAEENIGRVWTIVSNEEKNVARIEEGHLWK
jgi:DNA sulfur modification protein DndD